jgi:hypothetical protein
LVGVKIKYTHYISTSHPPTSFILQHYLLYGNKLADEKYVQRGAGDCGNVRTCPERFRLGWQGADEKNPFDLLYIN